MRITIIAICLVLMTSLNIVYLYKEMSKPKNIPSNVYDFSYDENGIYYTDRFYRKSFIRPCALIDMVENHPTEKYMIINIKSGKAKLDYSNSDNNKWEISYIKEVIKWE